MSRAEAVPHPRAREAGAFAVLGASLLIVAALASYSPFDASYFASSGSPRNNWIGPVGAQLAATLYELLGLAAWFLPAALVATGLRQLRGEQVTPSRSALLGLSLAGVATALLLTLFVGTIGFRGAPLQAGGFAGHATAGALATLFGNAGAIVISTTLLMAGLAFTARSSLAESVRDGYTRAREGWPAVREAAAATSARLNLGGVWTRFRPRIPLVRKTAPAAPEASTPTVHASAAATPILAPAEPSPPPLAEPAAASPPPVRERKPPTRRPRQARLPVSLPPEAPAELPPTDLLSDAPPAAPVDRSELLEIARLIEARCAEFAVGGKVLEIHPGPVVTTYEFKPEAGIKLSRITALADDLALALEAENVRIDRIPGRPAVGIEVPTRNREVISFREVVESESFARSKGLLNLGLGKTQEGQVHCASLAKMPHLLIAGSTGAGKSVGLNGIITSLLYQARPDEVKFILIDPKMLELGIYEGMPHLLVPVVTDMNLAVNALKWAVREMERRYKLLAACNVRHLDAFNRMVDKEPQKVAEAIESVPKRKAYEKFAVERVPYVVIVVDELADLMMATGGETTESIARLAQKARAAGIHLVLATQRPSVDVLTGVIKANFPARIAYRVASKIDSRTILDASGAERLLGAGDMLYRQPGSSRIQRIHGAFLSEDETLRIVEWLKGKAQARYDDTVVQDAPDEEGSQGETGDVSRDPVFREAVRTVISTGQASTSFLQRRMRLGYSRAARMIDEMEQAGIVGPADGSRPRTVLVGPEFIERLDQIDRGE